MATPAQTQVLSNLGNSVSTRTISWNDLVQRSWGSEFRAPDHDVYKFSNGRGFDSTDQSKSGVYGITDKNYLMVSDGRYTDMASNSHMLQETFDRLILE